MPIKPGWDNAEQTIYCLEMSGDWNWPEFGAEILKAYHMIAELSQTVDFVMNFQGALPPGNVLGNLRVAGGNQPGNIRHTVVVNNASEFLETLITSVDRTRGWEGPGFVASMDEARAYLAARSGSDEPD